MDILSNIYYFRKMVALSSIHLRTSKNTETLSMQGLLHNIEVCSSLRKVQLS